MVGVANELPLPIPGRDITVLPLYSIINAITTNAMVIPLPGIPSMVAICIVIACHCYYKLCRYTINTIPGGIDNGGIVYW